MSESYPTYLADSVTAREFSSHLLDVATPLAMELLFVMRL